MAVSPPRLALDFGRVLTLDQDRTAFSGLLARLSIEEETFFRCWAKGRLAYDRGDLDARRYWRSVLAGCSPDLTDLEAGVFVPELIEADFLSWARPRTALHRLVQKALDAGVVAAIVSNMPSGIGDRFVTQWPWLERVPHRFFSADFGEVKPDPAFYRHVLDRTGWEPHSVLFVDDHGPNVEAAAEIGFVTRLFTGSEADLRFIADWCGVA